MHNPPRILIADDDPTNLDVLRGRLAVHGYGILTASDGEEAIRVATHQKPDLILLDIMMPKLDGIAVCRRLKGDASLPFMPIIAITAKSDPQDVVAGLEAGADEYLTKPFDQVALVARIKSMLKIKALQDQLAELNRSLECQVAQQLAELERLSHLKRFFSPHIAESIVSAGDQQLMESHRREITVVIGDLRGFTAFSEAAEPEEVLAILREYHDLMGPLIFHFEGTLSQFQGDAVVAFFNDPIPCDDPAARAVRMAVAMQKGGGDLAQKWRKRGYDLGLSIGIALGYATLGRVGFEGQFHYGAVGSVMNLAFRLCDQARGGQILATQRVYAAVEEFADMEPIGELTLKGFHRPVPAFQVLGLKGNKA
jgi:adenylate cyclase